MIVSSLLLTRICFAAVLLILLSVSAIDIRRREIPNWTIVALILLWLIFSTASILYSYSDLADAIVGAIRAAVIFAVLLLITYGLERLKGRELFGGGDIKLIGSLALFLDISQCLIMLLVACVISLLFSLVFCIDSKKGQAEFKNLALPWAPFLSTGFLVAVIPLQFLRVI